MEFAKDFIFGVGTAAYQVEGGATEGGKSPSIWDTFSHTPGTVRNGDTGDVACDQYHRWADDVALIKELGLDAYRFSISWPRVMPDATGRVNPEGIAYYRNLCDALHKAGLKAVATLYHWDLPQTLQDAGGWPNRNTALAFGEYARQMARELGDVVDIWGTLNEPWCSSYLGYASGAHAPGHVNDLEALQAVHHLNLAHGLATKALREELGNDTTICLALNLHVAHAASDNPQDIAAARRIEVIGNEAFLQPVMEGKLSSELVDITHDLTDWSFVKDGDLEICHQVPDILGVNYYSTNTVRQAAPGEAGSSGGHGETGRSPWVGCDDVLFLEPQGPLTEMGWNIEPTALRDLLLELSHRYPDQKLMVTENGGAFPDTPTAGETVHDQDRIDYLRDHLNGVGEAIDQGAPITGYFLWSLLDNFEWAWGYEKRFGIVRVNYETQQRTPKDSARWYSELAQRRVIS